MLGRYRPKGLLTHSLPFWLASKIQGFHVIQNAVAAQNQYAGVLNTSSRDTLYCIGVNFALSSGSYVFVELVKGNPGSAYADGGSPVTSTIDPNAGQISATPWNFSVAGCIGNHVGGINGYNTANTQWFPGFPIAILPPGWSVAFQCQIVNCTIEATIYVLPVPT